MPPTSTEHSRALWKSDDAGEWRAALDAYDERLAALNHPKLLTLDSWFRHELPSAVRSRDPPRLLARELVELVDWKMTRGKVRPNLLNYAKAHAAKTVEDASAAALRALDDVLANKKPAASALESALAPLIALKGIGPATASAVLAAATEHLPMMSDELIAVALPATSSSDTYSAARLVALAKAARAKGLKTGLTPREVERAVYSAAAITKKPKKDAAAAVKKRKAGAR